MTLTLPEYIAALSEPSRVITFEDTLSVIDAHYNFTPTAFKNGEVENPAGENSGSCKVFGFAKLHGLGAAQTLEMFAQHYTNVKNEPTGTAHANIRAFMKTGFEGLAFSAKPLALKS